MPPKPVHIAQISDLHIKPPGSLAYGRVDTAGALERCVSALNEFRPKPDLVVISGDIADTPTIEEYEYLTRLLAPLTLSFVPFPAITIRASRCAPRFYRRMPSRSGRSIRG